MYEGDRVDWGNEQKLTSLFLNSTLISNVCLSWSEYCYFFAVLVNLSVSMWVPGKCLLFLFIVHL